MKTAILGFGIVGSGAYEVLEKAGYEVKKVLDIKPHPELGDKLTSNFDDILNDKEISVVAEAIGGLEPAHTFVVKALRAKKNVVSSNKHLICTYYDELLSLAKDNNVKILFTASAGGGIPWLFNLKRSLCADDIIEVSGIINGTTNYILDAMETSHRLFNDVLEEAKSLGFAEANPSADIDGLDLARKIAISSSIAFNTVVKENQVSTLPLRNITLDDIDYCKTLGKKVKYMSYGIKNDNTLSIFVEPTLIDCNSIEASVSTNNNMVSLYGKNVGKLSFYGQGAGKYPTGHSLACDVIDIITGKASFEYNPKELSVDNNNLKRKYFIRTTSDVSGEIVFRKEQVDNVRYIITNYVSVSSMNRFAKEILLADEFAFIAGFEEK